MKKNKNDFGEEKKHSFSKGDSNPILPLETETELLLKKMERLHKKKNNYKNIDELENIYDTKPSKKENTGFLTGVSDFLHKMNNMKQELSSFNFEGFDQEGMDEDGQEGMDEDDQEGMDEDDQEGMDEDDQEGMDEDGQEGMDEDGQEGMDEDGQEGMSENKITNQVFGTLYETEEADKKKKLTPRQAIPRVLRLGSRTSRSRTSRSIPAPDSSSSTSSSSKKKPNKSWEKFKNFVKTIIQNPRKLIHKYIATPLYNSIYSGTRTNRDIDIITNQIILFIYACLTIHISGNWYYLMFYKGANYQRVKSQKFYDFLTQVGNKSGLVKKLRLDAQLKPVNVLNEVLCEIFGQMVPKIHDYLIYPVYITLSFLFNYKSTFKRVFEYGCTLYNSAISNTKFLFIIFTFFIFYCILKYSSRVYREYLGYTKSKKLPEKSSNILSFIVIFEMLFGISALMSIISGASGVALEQASLSNRVKTTLGSISTILFAIACPILYLLFFFIGLTFNVMILRVSGVLCVIYLYVYSYFGAYIRNDGAGNKLNEMFRNLSDPNPCDNASFDTRWLDYLIAFVYDNLTTVLVVLISAWSIFVYNKRMKNKKAALLLIIMNTCVIIFSFLLYFIRKAIYTKLDLRDYNYIEPYNQ